MNPAPNDSTRSMIVSAASKARVRLRALALFAFLCTPTLLAAGSVELLAPEDGATLRGGSVATIAWNATAPLPRAAEEWEAFLSVDGGSYYAVRLTPHLGIDVRSFTWHVPNVSSQSVRLLIRIGNEKEESLFELPLRLSIKAGPEIRSAALGDALEERGESARPGDARVSEWAAGDRSGRGVSYQRAHPARGVSAAAASVAVGEGAAAGSRSDAVPRPRIAPERRIHRSRSGVFAASLLLADDILVEISRLNI